MSNNSIQLSLSDDELRRVIRETIDTLSLDENFSSWFGNRKKDQYFSTDWYDGWYAAIALCIKLARLMGTDMTLLGDPNWIDCQKLINELQVSIKSQRPNSLGWIDGINDCIEQIQYRMSREGNIIKFSILLRDLDLLRRRPHKYNR